MRRACWIVAGLATAVLTGWAAQPPTHAAPTAAAQEPVTIASGATKIARWELYVSAPRPGRRCVGLRVEQLWAGPVPARRERCGGRKLASRAVTLHTLAAPGMGSFAFGRAGRKVARVSFTVGDRARVIVATLPSPTPPSRTPPSPTPPSSLGGRDRFWVAHAGVGCGLVSVQALGGRGNARGGQRTGRIGPPGCG
jgi:hypothetical protein